MATILVVDDDPSVLEALSKYLEKSGYTVEGAPNGKEALQKVLARMPDLIILDLYMPQLNGGGLLEILRSYLRLQKLPVIVLSGLTEGPVVERVKNLKASQILVKGKATMDDIVEAVRLELSRVAGQSGNVS